MGHEETSSATEAVIEKVESLAKVEPIELTENTILVLPEGKHIEDMKPYLDARRTAPERREGTSRHTTLDSFNAHVVRFADEHSAIFASDDARAPSLLAVLDYHERGHAGGPRFGTHRSLYQFPLSDEWKAWINLPEKIEQATLASFLEDHIGDVLDPAAAGDAGVEFAQKLSITLASPARLMELSRGLSVRVDMKVANVVSLGSGESKLHFEETHSAEGGGPLSVPGGFMLAIPVFKGGDLFKVPARLTYRASKQSGQITWRIALHRTDKVFRVAFGEAVKVVEQATGLPVFYGAPEST
jgi:hypothetical protein